ncbi:MAG: acetamidase/formamidase family protein [Candidatus Obscuribacterales bacterium]|nr:acetamidase/formamidase family protein [Candidatus Obscuribacterales bacterium]
MQTLVSRLHKTVSLPLVALSLFVGNLGCVQAAEPAGAKTISEMASIPILQRMHKEVKKLPDGTFYVPAVLPTIRWGFIPNKDSKPILTVPSGSTIVFDTLSSEGMVEDQGRDPVKFFGKFGVPKDKVLEDAVEICASHLEHNITKDGPHIIIGPIEVEGAQPGDVLKVDMLELTPRVPYGIIGNRHGKGALPGEYPQNNGPEAGASKEHPELYGNVFTFVPIKEVDGKFHAVIRNKAGKDITWPIAPFMGTMGVAPDSNAKISSIPPSSYGGNMDIKDFTVGSSLYLPIQVKGGMFFLGDCHFAQGDGEVALTALEASLRSKLKLTLLKAGSAGIPGKGLFTEPFGETPHSWIPIGLDPDLNVAMKKTVRAAIKFLVDEMGMDNAAALAYLSAATDFEVSQVVDEIKGVHAHINKQDFKNVK